MKPQRMIAALVVVVSVSLVCPSSYAQVVSFNYSGVFTSSQDSSGLFPDLFQVGSSFSGTVTYDPAQAVSRFGTYYFSGGQITLTSSGHTFLGTTDPLATSCLSSAVNCKSPFYILANNNNLQYGAQSIAYDGQPLPGTPAHSDIQLALWNTTQTNNSALPTSAPDLTKFNASTIGFWASGSDFSAPQLYSFNGIITDISVTAVPEPESYAMLLAGLGLLGLMARQRKQKAA